MSGGVSLLVALMGGVGVIGLGVGPFFSGFWIVGVAAILASFSVFQNLEVECVSWFMWMNLMGSALIVMSLWVIGLSYLSTEFYGLTSVKLFSFCIYFLGFFSSLFFLAGNWFILYFFFESSLLPILMLILGWGYQPERLQAAGYMVMYTISSSLPLLGVLGLLFVKNGSVSFFSASCGGFCGFYWLEWLLVPLLMLPFMVKFPVYGVHSWLPKAHVEAPVAGSMILAGVLLKFGGYGLMVLLKVFSPVGCSVFLGCSVGFVLWGGFLASVMCLRQVDMKAMVAYSSVGHMAMCYGGLVSCYHVGWSGSLMLMVSHGLCSAGLFAFAGFYYSLFGSRSFFLCRGAMGLAPGLSLFWFLFCSGNMAFPPSLALFGEVLLAMSMVSFSFWMALLVGGIMFMAGVYSMVLYSLVQHGRSSSLSYSGGMINPIAGVVTFLLWVPLNFLVLSGDFMYF